MPGSTQVSRGALCVPCMHRFPRTKRYQVTVITLLGPGERCADHRSYTTLSGTGFSYRLSIAIHVYLVNFFFDIPAITLRFLGL